MRVLVTGATGLIGGAVARRLKEAGHEVVGLARSEASAGRLTGEGFTVMHGDLSDPVSIASAARVADAVVHAASPNDQNTAAHDETATRAFIEALRGSGKRFAYTSGCLVYGSTGDEPATEDSSLNPIDLVRWRQKLEGEILESKTTGVHPVVIRPAWVYGNRGGTAMMMYGSAKEYGAARYVGDGQNRWTTVHADDLADLYVLALERAPAASIFNGAHGAAVPLVEIARAASEGAGSEGRVAEWPLDDARQALWGFADAIACDQVISGELAQRELGWSPSRHSIIDELRSYSVGH
ncbi:NAD-dependent epimerase/dehydratase family protein [Lichenibacterium minor]|uniref:NAD-dependent epimerase/dehydratase family protein n=1 Tax=Lichenibacterium minor TaxID=2316528 RepID=A0A4Q2U2B5_9HYPH|nr:NAD-dependent epimerase/dehydratase family protein [Lichenibacterium minor]RYC28825.1 NAD-dependent epimerase/dehydratase family protein [Lichenibacterium minor]